VRIVLGLLLTAALAACQQDTSPSHVNVPRPVANYGGASESPTPDQCSLPVEQRTGGWFCYETPSPTP
jgi:hypothetical protein